MKEETSFIPTPIIKPKREPIPALKDFLNSSPLRDSAIIAPAKGPIMRPMGGKKNIPMTIPIVAPQIPALDPPIFFVPHIGTI